MLRFHGAPRSGNESTAGGKLHHADRLRPAAGRWIRRASRCRRRRRRLALPSAWLVRPHPRLLEAEEAGAAVGTAGRGGREDCSTAMKGTV